MNLHASGRPDRSQGTPSPWRPPQDSGLRETGIAVALACLVAAPFVAIGGWRVYANWSAHQQAIIAAAELPLAYERLVAAPALPTVDAARAAHGRDVFLTTCVACHGPNGRGVTGLGKDLVESDFVAAQSDEDLAKFLAVGRPDARPLAMPPRGGRADLTDDDLHALVVYLRGLQDPRRMPDLPAPALASAAPTEDEKAKALAAAGGDEELAEYIASGTKLFNTTCIACHGAGGVGITGNGKPLVNNEFIRGLDDDALLAFIQRGRDPSDPKNTTGVGMPPKGGNPALSEDDLLDIIAYLRTLPGNDPGASASNTP